MTTLDLDAWEMFAEINVGRGYPGQAFLSNTQTLALIAEVKALREKVAAVESLAQQIAENAEVNWEQDNFGAGQQQAANQILDSLQSDTPTTGEPDAQEPENPTHLALTKAS